MVGSPYAIGPLSCPVCLSVGNVGVLLPSGCMDQNETWHGGRLGPGHIVLDGDPAPPPQKKGGTIPQFSAHVHCGQRAGWIKMSLGEEVGLDPSEIVLMGTHLPLKRAMHSLPLFGP